MAQHSWFRTAASVSVVTLMVAVTLIIYTVTMADAATEFADDDGSVHEPAIEALAAAGITNGCGAGLYCPERSLSRAEAASLLVRALALPPAASASSFSDIGGSPHESDIAALQAAGITNGCETDRYCGERAVTRSELALLINRAFGLASSNTNTFSDDDGLRSEPAIESLVAAGITTGCERWAFCPAAAVTRAEAASFLARSLGLSTARTPSEEGTSPTTIAPSASTTVGTTTTTTVAGVPPTVPGDAVLVAPGASLGSLIGQHPEGTVFALQSGTHVVSKVYPKNYQQFIGGPGVVISGQGVHERSFGGDAIGVVIDSIVFENFANPPQFGVIHAGGRDWIIRNNEFRYNAGAGVAIASGYELLNNYIHHNAQIGVVSSLAVDAVVQGNEIAYNNYEDKYEMAWEAGGAKFTKSTNMIIRDNYVHNNHGPGLWTDANNIGTLYEGNRVIDNHGPGIFHEISYDAVIRNNYAEGNAFDFYIGGILITESSNVQVLNNTLVGNNGGVAAIDTDRGSGFHGTFDTKNLLVAGNEMSYSSGWTGIRDNVGDGRVYSDGNVFRDNVYNVASGTDGWFWNNTAISWDAWRALGMK